MLRLALAVSLLAACGPDFEGWISIDGSQIRVRLRAGDCQCEDAKSLFPAREQCGGGSDIASPCDCPTCEGTVTARWANGLERYELYRQTNLGPVVLARLDHEAAPGEQVEVEIDACGGFEKVALTVPDEDALDVQARVGVGATEVTWAPAGRERAFVGYKELFSGGTCHTADDGRYVLGFELDLEIYTVTVRTFEGIGSSGDIELYQVASGTAPQ